MAHPHLHHFCLFGKSLRKIIVVSLAAVDYVTRKKVDYVVNWSISCLNAFTMCFGAGLFGLKNPVDERRDKQFKYQEWEQLFEGSKCGSSEHNFRDDRCD